MSANTGAWGVAMYKDGHDTTGALQAQEQGISLEGGDPVLPYLPTDPVGTLLVPPAGLGVPGIRSGDVAFAQRDGVVQFADYYEPRQITLTVLVQNDDCPGCGGGSGLSARQKVSRLTQEWSRNCSGATLVLFTDCHDPGATEEEKIWNGPYMIHGRPRVAEVVWERSNRGAARVTLRFDAADARLVLADTIPGTIWTSEQVQSVDADQQNLALDPDLSGLSMSLNGATVDDAHHISGGPNDGPYFRRHIIASNTSSPMSMPLSGTGVAGYPVDPGDVFSFAWWAREAPNAPVSARLDWTWYNAAGSQISNHNGTLFGTTDQWVRYTQENIVAPALAEFVQWRIVWSGTASAEQDLDFAQVWINEGPTSTAPQTVEIVGTLCVYPVITLFPELTAPIVVTYGNHQFTYTENIPVGTVVTVDTRWGRARNGFVDVTANIEGDYSSPLEPGVHDVTVQTGDPADTGFVNFVWENAVVSG